MGQLTNEELKAKLTEDKNFLNLSESERINILMQEVARLHKENIEIREQMIDMVNGVKKSLLLLNKELTRIAKQ